MYKNKTFYLNNDIEAKARVNSIIKYVLGCIPCRCKLVISLLLLYLDKELHLCNSHSTLLVYQDRNNLQHIHQDNLMFQHYHMFEDTVDHTVDIPSLVDTQQLNVQYL